MGQDLKDNRLAQLLDMERLQNLQDNLATALDLAFITVDYQGRPVTQNSGFTDFCSCMRSHGKYSHLCSQCYAHAGLHATITGKPYICRCHCGLVEVAVPLMADGTYLGVVMSGQCELEGEAPEPDPVLPQRTSWEEDPELVRLRRYVHKTTYEKLEAGVRLVQQIIRNMLEEEHSRRTREELAQRNRELMEEKAARVNLELSMKEEEEDSDTVVERLDREHLFYVLNVISRLAFLEKAEETERTACDFAAMMRYVLENSDYDCVTLGEELEYIDYYLQIQKRRMEGRLRYEVCVPEKYHSVLCPFMMLHPLVKKMVKPLLDNGRDGGSLTLLAREEKNLLVLSICCNGTGQLLDPEGKRREGALSRIDRSLKNVFGRNCGVTVRSRGDDLPGTEMQIRLPLQAETLGR